MAETSTNGGNFLSSPSGDGPGAAGSESTDVSSTTGFTRSFFDDGDSSPTVTHNPTNTLGANDDPEHQVVSQEVEDAQDATAEAKGVKKAVAPKKPTGKEPAKVKTYKADAAGRPVELPLDASFSIPIDGKTTSVTLNELVQNYNGKVGWDKKYSQIDSERKAFQQEKQTFINDRDTVNAELTNFFGLVQQGQGSRAWSHLIKAAGLEGKYSLNDLRKDVLEQARAMEGMSPEQRESFEAKEQAEYYKSQYEQHVERQKSEQAHRESQERLGQFISSHGVTPEQYNANIRELQEGGIAVQEITPNLTVDFHKRKEAYQMIGEAARAVDPSILKDDVMINRIRDFKLQNPDFTAADIADVMRTVRKTSRAQNLSNKARQTPSVAASMRKPPAPRKPAVFDRDELFF